MTNIFAPGCALMLYKPGLATKLHKFLCSHYGDMDMLLTCCRYTPEVASGKRVINICPGCDRRYRENYDQSSTISLWELLAENNSFILPDYDAQEMTIIDACPTRDQDRIHNAVRALVDKMNISIIEPDRTRRKSTCCGDTFFGNLPTKQVIAKMKEKALEMPVKDIFTYCVSCSKSMFVGRRSPRYLLDLLFNESTIPKTFSPDQWHREMDTFIESHKGDGTTCG